MFDGLQTSMMKIALISQFALDEPKVVQQFFCSGSLFHGFDRKQQNLTIFSISCQNSLETNESANHPIELTPWCWIPAFHLKFRFFFFRQ